MKLKLLHWYNWYYNICLWSWSNFVRNLTGEYIWCWIISNRLIAISSRTPLKVRHEFQLWNWNRTFHLWSHISNPLCNTVTMFRYSFIHEELHIIILTYENHFAHHFHCNHPPRAHPLAHLSFYSQIVCILRVKLIDCSNNNLSRECLPQFVYHRIYRWFGKVRSTENSPV